jgi:hypothetical protein
MNQEPSTPLPGPSQAPDFNQVRKYLKDISQRERLGEYIKAGWTPAELAEYARLYRLPSKTYPTASAYQIALGLGPDSAIAKTILAQLRTPGYTMPPFNRPVPPPPIPWDDPDHPDHTPEIRADVQEIARCLRNRRASWDGRPPPDPDKPVPRGLWKRCFHLRNRNRYCSRPLEYLLEIEGLAAYR